MALVPIEELFPSSLFCFAVDMRLQWLFVLSEPPLGALYLAFRMLLLLAVADYTVGAVSGGWRLLSPEGATCCAPC